MSKFEIFHGEAYQTDAADMADALNACELWSVLGLTNIIIRRKADGKTWKWN